MPQLAQSNFSSYVSVWHSQWDDHIPTHHTICSYHAHTHHMILLVAQGNEEVKKAPCIACPVGRNFCSNTCLWEKIHKDCSFSWQGLEKLFSIPEAWDIPHLIILLGHLHCCLKVTYTRTLTLRAFCSKFLCVVDLTQRLSNDTRVSVNFISHTGWAKVSKNARSWAPVASMLLMVLFLSFLFDCQ